MAPTEREILHGLTAPLVLDFPDYDAVADDSRLVFLYRDTIHDGIGAAFKQEQPGGSVRPMMYTLDSERSRPPRP